MPIDRGAERMVSEQLEQLGRRRVGAERRVGVAADDEGIVHARLRHRGEDSVEVVGSRDHARREMDGHVMAQLAQAGGDLDGPIGPVLGRARDGEAHALGQMRGLVQAPREREHLKTGSRERGVTFGVSTT